MKILVISNMYPSRKNPSYGVFVKSFCESLDDLKIDYSCAIMHKANGRIEKIVRYVLFYITSFFKILFLKYDIIYVHYASYSGLSVLLAHRLKSFRVYTNLHGSDVVPENDRQKKMIKYTKKIISISDKLIVPSDYFRDYVSNKFDVGKEKIYISHSGGVDRAIFHVRDEKNSNERFRIGFAGRISFGKGWKTLLEAVNRLNVPDYEVLIVGNGPDEEEMMNYIIEHGLDSKIRKYDLLPRCDLANIYQQLDLFIFPTEREGESLGLVAIEAMACGIPVIASDFAAPAYFVKNYYNGFKFEKGNSHQLANFIEKFYYLSAEEKLRLRDGAIATACQYEKNNVTENLKKILVE